MDTVAFEDRFWGAEPLREDDERDQYQRDKARVIHSAAFRRLQAKTQVMGVGEGDFHRTRLTHSIEAAQIGEGIVGSLKKRNPADSEIQTWFPSNELIAAACYAHDLGHPPFGHGGERALHRRMLDFGGFEGNGQTLRILTRLEKYRPRQGMNPTRRLLLAVLKYPAPMSAFQMDKYTSKPPKCYFDTEDDIVNWMLRLPFRPGEIKIFRESRDGDGKPCHRTLDCSIMECADDIAYGVHDLEDVVARHLIQKDESLEALKNLFNNNGRIIGIGEKAVSFEDFATNLFSNESANRKKLIGKLVHLFITSVTVKQETAFDHPLLRYRACFDAPIAALLKQLKQLTYDLVVQRAEVQQLEHRGQRIVERLFDALLEDPERLIPMQTWTFLNPGDSRERRVCDYIAGMTDPFAERIYKRLFIPGTGSSHDEL
ncbi:MAG TPA: anti-phage deoxyguanosine triphosphatase [Azospirillaceae bacterium]|nr:anti-phage deoxyguanosine triphosphatase [Azospirillaceae bacterium]